MTVSRSNWVRYIRMLAGIHEQAARDMQAWLEANPEADSRGMVSAAYALVQKYGNAAGALACVMYDELAAAQGATAPSAEIADNATYRETAKAVYGTLKNKRNTVSATVGRLVKLTGADTMLQNARRDRAQFAWVPQGDTCAFCLTLASRGWQYMSKKTLKNGHAEHIHANCDCTYAVRFDGTSTVEGYDPDALLEKYESFDGTPNEKIKAWRREIAAEQRALEAEGAKKIPLPGGRDGGIVNTKAPVALVATDKQFGKKAGKHASDFGLDPASDTDRQLFRNMLQNMFNEPDEIRQGSWRGYDQPVLFYVKGADVLIVQQNGEYITTLKGGVDNARFANARRFGV